MGISIHYKGSIRDLRLVKELQEEIVDICGVMNWDYRLIDEPSLRGVAFEPHPKCESVILLFNCDGNLVNFFNPMDDDYDDMPWVSVKTQFAGVAIHIIIVKLLRYLKKKYVPNLEVEDEGEYWEKEDKHLLKHKFDYLKRALDKVESIFVSSELRTGNTMTAEELLDRMEELLKKGLRDMDGPESEESLRQRYGNNIKVSRVGKFNLIHLDNPDEETMRRREREFDPSDYFDDDCPLCQEARKHGGNIIFEGDDASQDLQEIE